MDENVPILIFGSTSVVVGIIGTVWYTYAMSRNPSLSAAVGLALALILILGMGLGAGIQDYAEGGFND